MARNTDMPDNGHQHHGDHGGHTTHDQGHHDDGDMHSGMDGDTHGDMHDGMGDDMHGDMNGDMHGGGHAMSPFLFSRPNNFFVLFQGAFIESTGAFVGALLLSALFAIIATILSQIANVHEKRALRGGSPGMKFVGSALHAFRQALHYIAMLIVMTMNIWIIIAVVVGHGLGWLIYALTFGKKVAKEEAVGQVVEDDCDC